MLFFSCPLIFIFFTNVQNNEQVCYSYLQNQFQKKCKVKSSFLIKINKPLNRNAGANAGAQKKSLTK